MAVPVEVTVTRSQIAPQGSLASYHTYYGPDGRLWRCWAELETSPTVRGIGHIKREPARGSTAAPETWRVTACLENVTPAVQAKITEISLAFDALRYAHGQPFVLVSTNEHEPRAGVAARAWEFGDVWLPGIVQGG